MIHTDKPQRRAPDTAQSDNARRYLEWQDMHLYWRDHKRELDEMLDASSARKAKSTVS